MQELMRLGCEREGLLRLGPLPADVEDHSRRADEIVEEQPSVEELLDRDR
jgi:hypothetical protein